jgi:ssDNA-binding Zn-finger/Zn-ribbon topoisomerase 1
MTRKKKEVIRCVVCGMKATKYIGDFGHSPLCDNPVCFHTRIDEINNEIIQAGKTGGADVTNSIV